MENDEEEWSQISIELAEEPDAPLEAPAEPEAIPEIEVVHETHSPEIEKCETAYSGIEDACYKELMKTVGDKKFDAAHLIDLAMICIPITKRVSNVDNAERKRILIAVLHRYAEEHDKRLLKGINVVSHTVDIMFKFRKEHPASKKQQKTSKKASKKAAKASKKAAEASAAAQEENMEKIGNCCMMTVTIILRILSNNPHGRHKKR